MGHVHILGEGGSIFKLDLPLHEIIEEKLLKGHLRRVNEDGTPYEEPAAGDGDSGDGVPTLPGTKPAVNAAKIDWVGWAVACGASPDDADAMTKTDLIEKYSTAVPVSADPPADPGAEQPQT